MRKWSVVVTLLSALTVPILTPQMANACSCAYLPGGPQVREHVSRAEAVFTGTPTDHRVDGDTAFYEFTVREVFTGGVGTTTVIAANIYAESCGTSFEIGTEYLVFAGTHQTKGAPWSDGLCSATTGSADLRTRAAAIEVFGHPHGPQSTDVGLAELDRNGLPWLWWVAGAGLVGALALLAGLAHLRFPPSGERRKSP